MKIGGREISGPNRVTVVFPRPSIIDPETGEEISQDIPIVAEAVSDLGVLDELLPEPKPPVSLGKGQKKTYNYKDPTYKLNMTQHNLRRIAYIVLKSLEPSDIEWDRVDMETPSTWLHYVDELKEAGFSQVEINKICQAAMEANALDEAKLDQARELFLRGRVEENDTSGQKTQAQNT